MKVVLFCGGLGLRLRDYADHIPKPMVPIGHRRKLLDAIAALASEPVAGPESPLPVPPSRAEEGWVTADAERRQLIVILGKGAGLPVTNDGNQSHDDPEK